MPDRKHPGVYIEEVPSSVRPVEAASTSTAAFIGWTPKGDLDKAVMVTSFNEFVEKYGSFYVDSDGSINSYLAHSVFQFFNNGGRKCYIVRVVHEAAQVADITLQDRKGADTLKISAINAGAWGNKIDLEISNGSADPTNEFNLKVLFDGKEENHLDLSMFPAAPNFVEKVITINSKLIRAEFDTSNLNTSNVPGTSRSGPKPETNLSTTSDRKLLININNDGFQEIELIDPVTTGDEIKVAIINAVISLTKLRNYTKDEAFTYFTCEYDISDPENPVYVLTSGTAGIDPETGIASSVVVADALENNAAGLLKLGITNGGKEQDGSAVLRPEIGTFYVGDDTSHPVTPGSDSTAPQILNDYQTGFDLLDTVRDFSILAVPGMSSKEMIGLGSNYCERRSTLTGVNDCFFIGETHRLHDTKEAAEEFVNSLTKKSPYTAVYFPWLTMVDPTGNSPEPILVPPSGFVAGMYAKIDAKRGVWKAPAGTEANIGGASGLLKNLTDAEQDSLNDKGINCIRAFPAAGLVIWGCRTLSTLSQPEWRYVPVRRTAIFLEVSIFNGIQWAVFEPNDEDLWASLRLNIGAFMMRLFREGAFQGDTPSKAFFVKCDADTTTQADIDAGTVNVLVGFAPLKPAEFVVIKISQKAGQAAV